MHNIYLLIFDILILPLTIIRLVLIYLFGSKYNMQNCEFLDIMMHASNPYYNQQEPDKIINTIDNDIRVAINYCSRYGKKDIPELDKVYEYNNAQTFDETDVEPKIQKISESENELLANTQIKQDIKSTNDIVNIMDNIENKDIDKFAHIIEKLELRRKLEEAEIDNRPTTIDYELNLDPDIVLTDD